MEGGGGGSPGARAKVNPPQQSHSLIKDIFLSFQCKVLPSNFVTSIHFLGVSMIGMFCAELYINYLHINMVLHFPIRPGNRKVLPIYLYAK